MLSHRYSESIHWRWCFSSTIFFFLFFFKFCLFFPSFFAVHSNCWWLIDDHKQILSVNKIMDIWIRNKIVSFQFFFFLIDFRSFRRINFWNGSCWTFRVGWRCYLFFFIDLSCLFLLSLSFFISISLEFLSMIISRRRHWGHIVDGHNINNNFSKSRGKKTHETIESQSIENNFFSFLTVFHC